MLRLIPTLIVLVWAALSPTPLQTQQPATTQVAVLGVSHSGMLVAESYQPAVLRAYIARVQPDAICIERPPEEFARGSHYEFTYEIQYIAVPYAREKGIELCPFDWIPDIDDQLLAFGVNVEDPPFVRGSRSYANFLTFSDSAALFRHLFYAESDAERQRNRDWSSKPAERARFDFARRLFLYRTFLQGMRVARAARSHPGGRILVIVGSMHKDDLEGILQDERRIQVVSPEQFGVPTQEEVDREIRLEDLGAIGTFNLLGAQSRTGNIDWNWMRRVVIRFKEAHPGPEARLFETRLFVLTGRMQPRLAIEEYRAIQASADTMVAFTWRGVIDPRRIDSFADPFANLTVAQRAALEEARERIKLGEHEKATAIRSQLESGLSPLKAAQLRAYWSEWLTAGKRGG